MKETSSKFGFWPEIGLLMFFLTDVFFNLVNTVLVWTTRLVRKGHINRHWMGSVPERTFLKLHYKYFLDNMSNEKGPYKQVVFGIHFL